MTPRRQRAAIRLRCASSAAAWSAGASRPATAKGDRRLLSGDREQIRDDFTWLAGQGVTEVFCDLNWDPQVGAPDADLAAATDRAAEILQALAPAS